MQANLICDYFDKFAKNTCAQIKNCVKVLFMQQRTEVRNAGLNEVSD